jgi:hypothetical protein
LETTNTNIGFGDITDHKCSLCTNNTKTLRIGFMEFPLSELVKFYLCPDCIWRACFIMSSHEYHPERQVAKEGVVFMMKSLAKLVGV